MRLRLLAPGLLVFVMALLASGVLRQSAPEGIPVSPLSTLLLLPIARVGMFLCGALAFAGAIVGGLLGGGARAIRIARWAALGFALGSALVALLTLADALATPWWSALDPALLRSFLTQIDEGRYLMAQVLIGIAAAWILADARPLRCATAATVLGIAVVLPAFTGHSASAVTHWVASATMLLHLLAMSAWLGGVLLLALVPTREAVLGVSGLSSLAMPTLLASGLASVVARVNDWNDFWHDRYALVLAVKIAVTVAVVWFGRETRRHIADTLAVTPSGKGVVSATRATLLTEASLMLVVLGLAVVLARMANP